MLFAIRVTKFSFHCLDGSMTGTNVMVMEQELNI